MIINSIALNNFTCFINETFIFERGMNLVAARNGGGKSQIFNGFYWAIFGEIYNRAEGFVNVNEADLLPAHFIDGDEETEVTISVEVRLEGDDVLGTEGLMEYCFFRSTTLEVGNDGIRLKNPEDLEISTVFNGETDFIDRGLHEVIINKLFPIGIRKFMWYVGETMKEMIDFKKGAVLEYALNQISYYPKYKRLTEICAETSESLEDRSSKKMRKEARLNKNEEAILLNLEYNKKLLVEKQRKIDEVKDKMKEYEIEQEKTRERLKNFDHFIEYQKRLAEIEIKIEKVESAIKEHEREMRSKLVSNWMLSGTKSIILSCERNLTIIEEAFQKLQDKANPIPNTLPGSDYVQKMIDDKHCYICEREIAQGDEDTISSLRKRLSDISINLENEIMTENFENLRRYKNRFVRNYPKIQEGIAAAIKKNQKLLNEKRRLKEKKKNLFVELEIPEAARQTILEGAVSAEKLTKEYDLRNNSIETLLKKTLHYENEMKTVKSDIAGAKNALHEIASKTGISNTEGRAQVYIELVGELTEVIRDQAYNKLIADVEKLSNNLYHQYLSGKPPAQLVIKHGELRFLDPSSRREIDISDLSQAQEHAGKLALVNSILKLSENKMNKSYPLVMDAPTSDFDSANTIALTKNMAKTFDQIIIMSKDYDVLDDNELNELVEEADINKFYRVDQKLFDDSLGWESVSNRYSTKEVLN